MQGVDTIFWDNDGVLVDTEHLYFQATRETLAKEGIELDEAGYHQWFLVEGRGAWHLVADKGASPEHVRSLRAIREARYTELLDQALLSTSSLVLAGVPSVLERLGGRFQMGVVTSAKRAHFEQVHARTGLRHHFEFVLTAEDYARTKPEPDPYLAAIAHVGRAPERCVVIEDSERGLRAAKAAGLRCIVIPTALTRRSDFGRADLVLDSIEAVATALLP